MTRYVLMALAAANLLLLVLQVAAPGGRDPGPPAARPGVPSLTLVGEAAPPGESAPAIAVPDGPESAAPAVGGRGSRGDTGVRCFTLGPYRERERVEATAERIRAAGLPARIRESAERELRGYWVFVPPLPDRAAAERLAGELTASGVKDFFVVQDDDQGRENAVSLGVFRQKRYADGRVQDMARLGYEVEVEPLQKDTTIFWLDYETRPGQPLDERFWSASLPEGAGIDRLARECAAR